jgi:hypothetical protein
MNVVPRCIYESSCHTHYLYAPILHELAKMNTKEFHPSAQEVGNSTTRDVARPILVASKRSSAGAADVYVMATASECQRLQHDISSDLVMKHFAIPIRPTNAQGRPITLHKHSTWPANQFIIAALYYCERVDTGPWNALAGDQPLQLSIRRMMIWRAHSRIKLYQWCRWMKDMGFRAEFVKQAQVRSLLHEYIIPIHNLLSMVRTHCHSELPSFLLLLVTMVW